MCSQIPVHLNVVYDEWDTSLDTQFGRGLKVVVGTDLVGTLTQLEVNWAKRAGCAYGRPSGQTEARLGDE